MKAYIRYEIERVFDRLSTEKGISSQRGRHDREIPRYYRVRQRTNTARNG